MSKLSVELSNLDIIDLNNKLKIKPLVFIGTKDMLHLVKDYKNKFFIINLDSSVENGGSGHGSHWVCMSTFKNYLIYADSYGVLPPLDVERWIKQRYDKFYWLNIQIQGVKASYCGWFVLFFLHLLYYNYILKKKSLFDFINDLESMFDTKEQTKNYNVINKYFSRLL